jgi:hypothetical protein
LVHSKERIVDVKERYSYGFILVICLGQLATEELRSKNRGEKGQEKHKENKVQKTADITENDHLIACQRGFDASQMIPTIRSLVIGTAKTTR